MKKELQDKLYAKYPQIFAQKDLSMRETAMCWGIDTGDGWYDIIDSLCSCIQNRVDNINRGPFRKKMDGTETPPFTVEATQVKEKFGGLRFYINAGDEYIYGAISAAENMSYRTCEVCGSPGKPSSDGWIRTLCQTHTEEIGRKWKDGDPDESEEE